MALIDVPSSYTIPIAQFPLAWRWTRSTHAVFSADELSSMHAVDRAGADVLLQELRRAGLVREQLADDLAGQRTLSTGDLDDREVERWLKDLPVAESLRVWLSYENSDALEVPWSLFVRRWSDFCYPSSDDLVVVGPDGTWALEYWHWELLVWIPRLASVD